MGVRFPKSFLTWSAKQIWDYTIVILQMEAPRQRDEQVTSYQMAGQCQLCPLWRHGFYSSGHFLLQCRWQCNVTVSGVGSSAGKWWLLGLHGYWTHQLTAAVFYHHMICTRSRQSTVHHAWRKGTWKPRMRLGKPCLRDGVSSTNQIE